MDRSSSDFARSVQPNGEEKSGAGWMCWLGARLSLSGVCRTRRSRRSGGDGRYRLGCESLEIRSLLSASPGAPQPVFDSPHDTLYETSYDSGEQATLVDVGAWEASRQEAAGHAPVQLTAQLWNAPARAQLSSDRSTSVAAARNSSWQLVDDVGWYDSQDRFQLTLTESSRVRMDVSGQWLPVQVSLQDSYGRSLGSVLASDRAGLLLDADLPAGSYSITVSASSWMPTSYWLDLEAVPTAATRPAPPARSNPAPANPAPAPKTPTPTSPVATRPTPAPAAPTAPAVFPDVAYYGGETDWSLNAIGAPEAWAQGYRGQGVVVAVIDTGVDRSHPDLQNSIWRNADEIAGDGRDNDGNGFIDDVFGWNFGDNNANTQDGNGHGTHVAGTIVAARDEVGATGVAYEAKVMPVRVLGADGSGSDYAVARGIRYAVDNQADVINLSLGSDAYSTTLLDALDYAARHDVLVVAAAGNEGAAQPSYPARFSDRLGNVISVGAYDRSNRVASFSNAPGGTGIVQVGAPGVDIYSSLPGQRYVRWNGTSMASPHVAGLAALMLSANPQLTAAEVRSVLVAGANRTLVASGAQAGMAGVNAATAVAQARVTQSTGTSSVRGTTAIAASTAPSRAAVIFRIALQTIAAAVDRARPGRIA